MTLDTLIAIMALLVAALTIAPRSRLLSIKSRIRRLDFILVLLSLGAIHILLFYKNLASQCIFPSWFCNIPKWPFSEDVFSPGQAAYMLMVATIVCVVWKLFFSRLSRSKIFDFQELTENLIHSNEFPALFALLEKDLKQLSKIARQDFFLSRIRNKALSIHHPNLEEIANLLSGAHQDKPSAIQRLKRLCRSSIAWIAKYLPEHEDESAAAHDVFRQVMTSKKVVRELTISRPYFAIDLLNTDVYEIHDFSDLYFRELLENKHSILYFELRSNQNLDSNHDYNLPRSNKILSYLFRDAQVAEKLGVWEPVGELFIERLDELTFSPQTDPYNRPMGAFHENEKWEDQLYVTIFFFDIMVSKALKQNIQWHMWLYYFPFFVQRIIKNYKIESSLIDVQSEWPTRYSYLLKEIITTLIDWLRMVNNLPADQGNVLIKASFDEHENGNIPKSTVFVLTNCIKDILLAEKLPESLRRGIADIALDAYFELRVKQNTENLAALIRHRLCTSQFESEEKTLHFASVLGDHVARQDRVRWHDQMNEFAVALSQAAGGGQLHR